MRRTITILCGAALLAACTGGVDDTADTSAEAAADEASGDDAEFDVGADGADRAQAGEEAAADADAEYPEPPADRFPRDVTFADYGVGTFVASADLATSTFATDADTASYALARAWLEQRGVLPPAEAIRVEEWVNAVDHGYPDPAPGETWAVHTDVGAPWWRPAGRPADADDPDAPSDTLLLRVGLQAVREVARAPVTVTLVVDTSGSMQDGDRLGLVQAAVDGLLASLDEGDQVAVVAYSDTARLVSELASDHEAVRYAVSQLTPQASTNAEAGLNLGFDVARAGFRDGTTNTVVLLSDGVANVGETGPEAILARIEQEADDGLTLHSVGVGMDNFNDVLLERLANDAGGAYAYVDEPTEATELFLADLPVLEPVAHDVKAQVTFDPAAVGGWRLIGYENRLLEADDLRDDRVGGGFVGAGHSVTALYELAEVAEVERLGTVTVRWADPFTDEVRELTEPIEPTLADDSPTFAAAAGVATAAEVLRGSRHVVADLRDVADRLDTTRDVANVRLASFIRDAWSAAQPPSSTRQSVSPPDIEVEDRVGR